MRYQRYRGRVRGLRGKGVLVSGGSSGIGLAAAERFLDEGCRVFVGGLLPEGVAGAVERLELGFDHDRDLVDVVTHDPARRRVPDQRDRERPRVTRVGGPVQVGEEAGSGHRVVTRVIG